MPKVTWLEGWDGKHPNGGVTQRHERVAIARLIRSGGPHEPVVIPWDGVLEYP